MEKLRVVYWDALKGLGIFLVVYHHLIVMGMRNSGYTSQVNIVLSSFFMPLFFFISGYFSSEILSGSHIPALVKHFMKNMRRLVFPSVFMFAFCLFYYHLPLQKYLFDTYKCGYWFTIVLFQCHVISYIVCYLFKGNKCLIINLLLSLFIYYSCSDLNANNVLVGLTSLNLFASNYFFFVCGSVYKTYIEGINKSQVWILLFCLILALLGFYGAPLWIKPFFVFAQILLLVYLFKNNEKNISTSLIGKEIACFGRNSLKIYFLHFYFLFKIDFLVPFLKSLQNDYCFRGTSCCFLVEIILVGLVSIFIVYVCIITSKIISNFKVIDSLCFGIK